MVTAIRAAISRGVPVWNAGDHGGCTRIYLELCAQLAKEDRRLATAAEQAGRTDDATAAGWLLRRAMDEVVQTVDSGGDLDRPDGAVLAPPAGAPSGDPAGNASVPDSLEELIEMLTETNVSGGWPSTAERENSTAGDFGGAPGSSALELISELYSALPGSDNDHDMKIEAAISLG